MSDREMQALDVYFRAERMRHLEEFREFLRIPSVSALSSHREDIKSAADWVARTLRGAGVPMVEVIPTPGHPIVYGAWLAENPETPTLLLYAHYDTQPADPLDEWTTPPFEPTIRNDRMYEQGRECQMQSVNSVNPLPSWLDSKTRALIKDIIDLLAERHPDLVAVILYGSAARHEERSLDAPNPSDVDLLAILDSDDPHIDLYLGDALFHTLGLAYTRHLDAPHEVQVQFASRTLREWDPTFIANVARDGIVLFTRGPGCFPFLSRRERGLIRVPS